MSLNPDLFCGTPPLSCETCREASLSAEVICFAVWGEGRGGKGGGGGGGKPNPSYRRACFSGNVALPFKRRV
jgi:hypothetical protein